MSAEIDGHGNVTRHPRIRFAPAPSALIHIRQPIKDELLADQMMKEQAEHPGCLVAYRDGNFIVSLHRESHPSAPVNSVATAMYGYWPTR